MALDEPEKSDLLFNIDGFDYIIDMDLFERVKPICIDSSPFGFRITGNSDAGDMPTRCGKP